MPLIPQRGKGGGSRSGAPRRTTLLALVSSRPLTEQYLAHASGALDAFERLNVDSLDRWVGDANKLKNLDQVLEELLNPPPG